VVVEWAVATDPEMGRVIRRGVTTTLPQNGHVVHVVAHGLPSTQWAHYQFGVMGAQSRIGRIRTLPGPRERVERLRFAGANCQKYQKGFQQGF
jgi:alkaline phosphatase D